MNQGMIQSATVSPAYRRDYKTKWEALEAWNSGLDFKIEMLIPFQTTGLYCSKRDFPAGVEIRIRYNQKQDVLILNGPRGE